MSFVRVTGTNFVRDTESMVLSNVDSAAREEYYSKVRMMKSQKEHINKINEEIAEMKTDMADIKRMLAQLLGHKQ